MALVIAAYTPRKALLRTTPPPTVLPNESASLVLRFFATRQRLQLTVDSNPNAKRKLRFSPVGGGACGEFLNLRRVRGRRDPQYREGDISGTLLT